MEDELLQLCGYGLNEKTKAMVARIKKNYSQFDEIVKALQSLQPILTHSDFYLSLQSDRYMINIRNDMSDPDDFLTCDAEIVVWANQHGIELEEGPGEIDILGFKKG